MNIAERSVSVEYDKLEEELLPVLKDRVFHVTSFARFECIKNDGVLKSNKNGELGFNFSEHSYGRKRGYICFFDLRNKTDEEIANALDCWYFLAPRTLGEKLTFLFPSQDIINSLIPYEKCYSETGCTYSELCIPYVESWHDGNINYESIVEVVIVNVTKKT